MEVYKNVLSPETLQRCLMEYESIKDKEVWTTSSKFWHDNVKKGTYGLITIADMSYNLSLLVMKEVEHLLPKESKGVKFTFQVWDRLSGLGWHNDNVPPFAATLYLNDNWDINFGGVFLWKKDKSDREFNAIQPTENMLVLNDSKQDHMVTPISPLAPEDRITIQLWGF